MFLGRPVGLLSLLDEQSSFPKATDANFVTKINQAFSKLPFYVKAKGTASGAFTIIHYAGKVSNFMSLSISFNVVLPSNVVPQQPSLWNRPPVNYFLARLQFVC